MSEFSYRVRTGHGWRRTVPHLRSRGGYHTPNAMGFMVIGLVLMTCGLLLAHIR